MNATQALPISPSQPTRRSVLSWALYDLANTIFSMNIVSLYFSLWVVNEMGGIDADYGNANSISMALMFFTAAILGALSDQAGRRKPFLIVTTLICVSFTALLGTGGLVVSLLFFIVANYMFQGGLIFYDSLLPVVSTEANRGKVGGFGVGLGYMGSFIGVGSGLLLLNSIGYTGIFRLSAVLFLLFALPCFFFVKEPGRLDKVRKGLGGIVRGAVDQTYRRGFHSIQNWPRYFGLWAALGSSAGRPGHAVGGICRQSRALVVSAGGSRGGPGGVHAVDAGGCAAAARHQVSWPRPLPGRTGALHRPDQHADRLHGDLRDQRGRLYRRPRPSSCCWSRSSSPWWAAWPGGSWSTKSARSARSTSCWLIWVVVLSAIVAIAVFDLSKWLFWAVATVAGVALGGVWAADRPYMLRLAPPRFVGEFYGLYAMVGRFASIIGPFMWGYIIDTLGLGPAGGRSQPVGVRRDRLRRPARGGRPAARVAG